MNTKIKTLLFILTCTVIFSNLSCQRHFDRKRREKGAKHFEKFFELINKLDLTDDQAKKIMEIQLNFAETNIDFKKQFGKNMIQTRKLMNDENASDDKILALAKESGEISAKMIENRTKLFLDIRKVLTKDQIIKLTKWEIAKFFLFPNPKKQSGFFGN